MSILSVIADNSLAIYAVCIPGLLISGGYVAWRTVTAGSASASRPGTPSPASRATPRRPLAAPSPATKPKSLEAGQAEHQARGEAKTVKVAPATLPTRDERKVDTARMPVPGPSADDAAKDDLFSGLSQGKKEEDSQNQRKAERLEELGFHAQAKQIPVLSPTEAAAKGHTELLADAGGPRAKPGDPKRAETRTVEEKAAAAAAAPAPAPSRTQTQELDDILSRIDKVLAENPVMATTTLGSASGESTAVKPATEAIEKKQPETGGEGQQKLF